MIEPTEADIGRLVIYKKDWMEPDEHEQGVITSISECFIFVRYGSDTHSKATYRKDLEFV